MPINFTIREGCRKKTTKKIQNIYKTNTKQIQNKYKTKQIQVERVEIKDVRLPVQLQRAMAAEAEAAREARAKVTIRKMIRD